MSILPIELLYNVLERVWSSTLTPAERVQLMITSTLVSKTWSTVYDDTFSKDIHIPCKSFYFHLFNDSTRDFSRCKRITFTVRGNLLPAGYDTRSPHCLAFMSRFDMKKLTSLRALHIVYYNTAFPDPGAQGFFIALPDYLPKLTISYTFSPDIPPHVIAFVRKRFDRSYKVRYADPRVGTLEVNGADEYITAIWESLFPKRRRLIRDGKEEKQRFIPVRTVFDIHHALPFLLLDIMREGDYEVLHGLAHTSSHDKPPRSPTEHPVALTNSRSNRRKETLQVGSFPVHEVEVDGVRFMSLSDEHVLPTISWPVSLGDVGYVETSSGAFSTLFNAFEPHTVASITIPSLYGYGPVQVLACSHDQHQDASGISTHSTTAGIDSSLKHKRERGASKARKAIRSIFKAASESVGRRAKNIEFKCLDKNVAELWFRLNMKKIIEIYGDSHYVSEGNIMFVTCGPI